MWPIDCIMWPAGYNIWLGNIPSPSVFAYIFVEPETPVKSAHYSGAFWGSIDDISPACHLHQDALAKILFYTMRNNFYKALPEPDIVFDVF